MIKIVAECDKCKKQVDLRARSMRSAYTELYALGTYVSNSMLTFCEECAKELGLLVRCPGEAHIKGQGGGFIDHCSVCAPRWGWVEPAVRPVIG